MNGFGQKLVKTTQRTAVSAAQAVAQQVRDETLEAARSTRQQILPTESAAPEHNRQEYVAQIANQTAQQGYDANTFKAETDAKLNQLRSQVARIQAELENAHSQQVQKQQEWVQSQEQQLKASAPASPEGPISPMGKMRKAMGGAARGMKAKLSTMQKGGEARASRSKD